MAKTGQNLAFSMLKGAQAGKKYTIAGHGGRDKHEPVLICSTKRANGQYKDHLDGHLATHMSLLLPLSNLSANCKLAQNHHKPRIQPTKFLIAFGQQLLAQLACSKMDLMAKQTFSCLSLSIYISSLFEAPSSL